MELQKQRKWTEGIFEKIMGEKFQNDERNKVSYSKAQTPPKK